MRVFPLVMPVSGITTILQCCATVQSHNFQLRRRLFMPSKLEFHIDIKGQNVDLYHYLLIGGMG